MYGQHTFFTFGNNSFIWYDNDSVPATVSEEVLGEPVEPVEDTDVPAEDSSTHPHS